MTHWDNRSVRLREEEGGVVQNLYFQHEYHIRMSIGSKLFNQLWCYEYATKERDSRASEILFNGKFACVHYVSQILRLLGEGLWIRPAGTWMKYIQTDLEVSGWYKIPEKDVLAGDIILWDTFDGNEHVGFAWHLGQAVSTSREDPTDKDSPRSPQIHPRLFDGSGRVDGPRTIASYWTHLKLRESFENQGA